MSGNIRRYFQLVYLSSLVVCLAGPISGAGCSKGVLGRRLDLVKTWTCDKQADKAMEQHDYEAGILLHQRFLEREPANGLALYHLGYAYGKIGYHQKEAFFYEKAIALGLKEDHIFFNLVMAHGELNQLEKAIDAFKKGLAVNPISADNYFGLALTYEKSGRYEAAESAFKKAIEINSEHFDARFYLSLLYKDMGEFQKARSQLRAILEIDPSNVSALELLDRIPNE